MIRSVTLWSWTRCLGAASLGLLLVSCGEPEPPTWGFDEAAIEALDLEGLEVRELGRKDPWFGAGDGEIPPLEEGCQQVMSMHLDEKFSETEIDAAKLRRLLGTATRIETECLGSCDGEICKVQHFTALKNQMQTARTRCVCAPREKPPCVFFIHWELGEETRRRIYEMSCVARDEGDDSCRFMVQGRGKKAQLTCSNR